MYATATASPAPAAAFGFANAYRQVSVQTGVHSASPHRLVAMLYEGLLDALAQARGAIAEADIELKGRAIGRALRIIDEGLRGTLDLERGGKIAADLDGLYAYVTTRLTHANLRNDASALDECRNLIQPVHEAWTAIAGQVEAGG